MIDHPAYPVEPWTIRETELHLDALASSESVFALSNGHLGLRGNLDEGEPYGLPGTYLGGFYETRPLPYAEAGYGYPEDGQTVVNVTNGKIIRLLVEDEPFDLRYGNLISHERVLDLRAGVLRRTVEWVSPTGRRVKVSSTRLVSFTHRAVAAIEYIVEPLDENFPVVVQSQLVANESAPRLSADPRAAAALAAPLESEWFSRDDSRAILVHRTKQSGLRMAAAMDHLVEGPNHMDTYCEVFEDLARFAVTADLEPGKPLRLLKLLAYGWSGERSVPALRDQVAAAGQGAKHAGWEGMLAEQRAYLDQFWEHSDVELEGDAELQQALRFALFHTLQAGARGEQRAIAAKGLTGPGYDGHTFWDTESFVLPVLTYTAPHAAADALRWRQQTLDLARERAQTLGLKGAVVPVAHDPRAGVLELLAGGDGGVSHQRRHRRRRAPLPGRDRRRGVRARHGARAAGRDGAAVAVTGPPRLGRTLPDRRRHRPGRVQRDRRQQRLHEPDGAAQPARRGRRRPSATRAMRHELGVDDEEVASWRDAANAIVVEFDEALGVHPQSERFTYHQRWDFDSTKPEQYPLLLNFPYFDLYRKQVVKQADLVLALFVCGDSFTAEEKARDFDYYEPLTVRDSSLSACTQAVVAAEVGHLDLAYDYFGEAALMDLGDLEHNTGDGIHIASVAGTWIAAVAGFGGMRDHGGNLTFAPRLPGALTRMRFRLMFCGRSLLVDVNHENAIYSLREGKPLEISHHGEKNRITRRKRLTLPIPPLEPREAPTQPPGREPLKRGRTR